MSRSREEIVWPCVCAAACVWCLYAGVYAGAVLAVAAYAFELHVILVWLASFSLFLGGIIGVILSLCALLILQWFPSTRDSVSPSRAAIVRRRKLALVSAALAIIYVTASTERHSMWVLTIQTVFLGVLLFNVAKLSLVVRAWLAKSIVPTLFLPAITVSRTESVMMQGRRMTTANAITLIRKAVFAPPPSPPTQGGPPPVEGQSAGHAHVDRSTRSSSQKFLGPAPERWVNVTMPGPDDVVIDGAYWLNPVHTTAGTPAQDQSWIVWLLGNGEVYEFSMETYLQFAKDVGANMFMFNFRGVALSQGTLWQASDLVADTAVVYGYLRNSLNAADDKVLFMGHSIGGAAAACFRGRHAPMGPIISDRSFSSVVAAGRGVGANLFQALFKTPVKLPLFVVDGLVSSIFKLDLDVTDDWDRIVGPKLIVFHRQDKMIDYEGASLHHALLVKKSANIGQVIELNDPGNTHDWHNVPMDVYPQYDAIVAAAQEMLRIASHQS